MDDNFYWHLDADDEGWPEREPVEVVRPGDGQATLLGLILAWIKQLLGGQDA